MDPVALAALACPHCASPLAEATGTLRCDRKHCFDVARQGYVNLSAGRMSHRGDTAEMVAARERFLASGHYDQVAQVVGELCEKALESGPDGVIVEVGAGTGWLLARLISAILERSGVAIDASKHAARRAARAHPRIASVVADAWGRLPLRDLTAAVIVSCFAPRNIPEFARALAPTGSLIVVTPAEDHLAELIERLGLLAVDREKPARLETALVDRFEAHERVDLRFSAVLAHDELVDLIAMSPNAHHRTRDRIACDVAGLPEPVRLSFAFECRSYRRL